MLVKRFDDAQTYEAPKSPSMARIQLWVPWTVAPLQRMKFERLKIAAIIFAKCWWFCLTRPRNKERIDVSG